ncbi:hypothetical protein BH10PSE6_BH10PSE6_29040 [soil metagenome]
MIAVRRFALFPPYAPAWGGGAVIRAGGVMGYTDSVAHDPSVGVRRRHLPALPRREESGSAA